MDKQKTEAFDDIVLAVHGGAGVIRRNNMGKSGEQEYNQQLHEALTIGHRLLKKGKSALDAAEAVVRHFEDCPLFNAGRGAVFTCDGKNELDACIMDGHTHKAGAVASVTTVKNPISAARQVMEQTEHVMLVGKGAERFAESAGIEIVDPSYFWTEQRWTQLQQVLRGERCSRREAPVLDRPRRAPRRPTTKNPAGKKYGTVGAVVRDRHGNLVAATSTGGMVNKRFGRVGDSPIVGAGTYADNATCAVSATGQGEYFMRAVAAYEVSALMKYKRMSLSKAADFVIHNLLKELGGDGGLIALDGRGNCALPFNTDGMFRGCVSSDGNIYTAIYGE